VSELLSRWREAAADRALAETDRHGWDRFLIATDSYGAVTSVRLAEKRRDSVLGVAIGHASLSHEHEGPRAPLRAGVWDAMTQLIEALGREPEPIGDRLAALDLPLLLAKHDGCLSRTDEGFEDIVSAFPDASTVICAETRPSSPAFAAALRAFREGSLPGPRRASESPPQPIRPKGPAGYPRRARSAFRITATSIPSWSNAPATGGM
jgi:hypothetical protein